MILTHLFLFFPEVGSTTVAAESSIIYYSTVTMLLSDTSGDLVVATNFISEQDFLLTETSTVDRI